MKKEYRIWASRIKKAEHPDKNSLFLDAIASGLDVNEFARGIAIDLPKGAYHLNGGEVNSIIDLVWQDYGMYASCEMRPSLFLGLSAISADRHEKINGKMFHASFAHNLNIVTIK